MLAVAALLAGLALAAVALMRAGGGRGASLDPRGSAEPEARALAGPARAPEGSGRERAAGRSLEVAHEERPEPAAEPEGGLEVLAARAGSLAPVPGAAVRWWTRDGASLEELEGEVWTALGTGLLDALLAASDEPALTDADGRARLAAPRSEGILIVDAAGLFGRQSVPRGRVGPVRVLLRPEFDLRARVVHADGGPAAGAVVCLREKWLDEVLDWRWAESDEAGVAVLRHVNGAIQGSFDHASRGYVALSEALDPPVEARFDPAAPPTDPLELALPGHGSCEVIVVGADGAPVEEPFSVSLSLLPLAAPAADRAERREHGEEDDDEPEPTIVAERQHVEGGRVVFRYVTPGRQVLASVQRRHAYVHHEARGPGPRAAGERATLTVRLGERVPILAGRLLDPRGAPLAQQTFRARLEFGKGGLNHHAVHFPATGPDGRFELDVPRHGEDDAPHTLFAWTTDPSGAQLAMARWPLPGRLTPGIHELGDVRLEECPLVAAGRVVDSAGRPVGGAEVCVSVLRSRDARSGQAHWVLAVERRLHCDALGRFEVRDGDLPEELALTASSDERTSERVEVARGALDVTLHLVDAGAIVGTVLLDPSIPSDRMQVGARTTGERRIAGTASWSTSLDEDGRFMLRGLRPGLYDVCVTCEDSSYDLSYVEAVAVHAGEPTRDPRLDPLDLSRSHRAFRLTVTGEDGAPVRQGDVYVRPRPGEEREYQTWILDGRITVLAEGPEAQLTIIAPGFLTERAGVAEDRAFVLRTAPRLRLALAPGLRLPEPPYELVAELPFEPGRESWRDVEASFGADGAAIAVPASLGSHSLSLWVQKRHASGATMVRLDPETARAIEVRERPAEQSFLVSFEPEALEDAIRRLEE